MQYIKCCFGFILLFLLYAEAYSDNIITNESNYRVSVSFNVVVIKLGYAGDSSHRIFESGKTFFVNVHPNSSVTINYYPVLRNSMGLTDEFIKGLAIIGVKNLDNKLLTHVGKPLTYHSRLKITAPNLRPVVNIINYDETCDVMSNGTFSYFKLGSQEQYYSPEILGIKLKPLKNPNENEEQPELQQTSFESFLKCGIT